MTTNTDTEFPRAPVERMGRLLKMREIGGGEIILPQDSILNFSPISTGETLIEYEGQTGGKITVAVCHDLLSVTRAATA